MLMPARGQKVFSFLTSTFLSSSWNCNVRIEQGSGTFFAERAIKATYFEMYFHGSYTIFFAVINVLLLTVVNVLYDLVHALF